MKLQTLFPLVVAVSELEGSSQHKDAFVKRILELRRGSENYVNSDSSWTGDVHGIDTLHNDPVFTWLSEQVVVQAIYYLDKLGYALNKYDLYLQRSWPVIGQKNQKVTPHTHPTAHLSAVYYVSIPAQGKGGDLIFINQARPNELFEGVNSNMTNGYRKINQFNAPSAHFTPAEGHLVIFPSNASHAVEPNKTDDIRISISYDLVLTSRADKNSGRTPEFILPSPSKWRKADFTIDRASPQPVSPEPIGIPEQEEQNSGPFDTVPEMKPLPHPM